MPTKYKNVYYTQKSVRSYFQDYFIDIFCKKDVDIDEKYISITAINDHLTSTRDAPFIYSYLPAFCTQSYLMFNSLTHLIRNVMPLALKQNPCHISHITRGMNGI